MIYYDYDYIYDILYMIEIEELYISFLFPFRVVSGPTIVESCSSRQ